jgi:1,4-alpha-glucan branching enzyme
MKKLLVVMSLLIVASGYSQVVTTNPPIFTIDQQVTIVFDATQGNAGLLGVGSVLMHSGIVTSSSSGTTWSNVVGQWGNPSSPGQMTSLGNNKWQITITPRTYYNIPSNVSAFRLGMVFREAGPCGGFNGVNADCKKGGASPNGADIFINVSQGGFDAVFTQPTQFPIFKNMGESILISASATSSADLAIKINGANVANQSNATSISINHIVNETGLVVVTLAADFGGTLKEKTFQYVVRSATVNAARPSDKGDGINYDTNDPTKAVLVFRAPLKSTVYVVGDFNDWQIDPLYQMKRDGDRFWIELTSLISGVEYAFQYLVDETIYTADPFCEKILDPNNDPFISPTVYPNLKSYPAGKAVGIVSVLQTGQVPYSWQTQSYTRPAKTDLVIYELLIRDFDAASSYQNVIDRLDYLKELGINAIELMPVTEFSGNNSWGYNPIFYMAPDKAYGTKNKLKELIDKAHGKGMAVILDMVLNQADFEFPYVKMYWAGDKPAANNPWFNQTATHHFSVFYDFNHEAQVTKDLVDKVNSFWLTEYKIDGYRFDLSKGFTQKVSSDVNAWNQYDQSRVDILTRMANVIWNIDPTAYVILEHLGIDDEERVLVNNGMMVWGIMQNAYKQNSLGFSSDSDISRTYFKNRSGNWNQNGVIAYMESHDEERIMVYNQQFGNSNSQYNVKSIATGLERMKSTHTFLLSIPGPKMIWQFGELGYDLSINRCENGTVDQGCRTSPKPIRWNYFSEPSRRKVYQVFSSILNLRSSINAFKSTDFTIQGGNNLTKQLIFKNQPFNPAPTSLDQANVVIAGNFDIVPSTATINFPHTGDWFHFFSGGDKTTVTTLSLQLILQPGEVRIYTDVKLPSPGDELVANLTPIKPKLLTVLERNQAIELMWEDNSTIETSYTIYRKTTNGSFEPIGIQPPNSTFFTDNSSLLANNVYEYYVQANNPYANSVSEIITITTSNIITNAEEETVGIQLFPNPSSGILVFRNLTSACSVMMFDSVGRRQTIERQSLDTFSFKGSSKGIHIVSVKCDGLQENFKVIVE